MQKYTVVGKQILLNGKHFADGGSEEAALRVQEALIFQDRLDAAKYLLPLTLGTHHIVQEDNAVILSDGEGEAVCRTISDAISDIMDYAEGTL